MRGGSLSRPPRSVSNVRLPILRALTLAGLAVLGLTVAAVSGAGSNPMDDAAPSWSPNGKTIAFAGRGAGNWQIFTVNASDGVRRELTSGALDSVDLSWSPEGNHIAFSRVNGGQVITGGHV